MHIIGILGGVASGKSLIARQLAELGAGVLDADRAGHDVLRLAHIVGAARQRWGDAVVGADGLINRKQLARIVFAPPPQGPKERTFLEHLTHPEIGRTLQQQAQSMATAGTAVAVLDAALILEAAWDRLCEAFIFVDAPRPARLARARARGWSDDDFAAREGAQESLDFKRGRADVIIDNSGSPDYTRSQVERYWQSLVG
ncbi:MAG: dephospho-CoA kinase [Thermoguttaceae bacterium]|jgi:dephospho-CoA kinase